MDIYKTHNHDTEQSLFKLNSINAINSKKIPKLKCERERKTDNVIT